MAIIESVASSRRKVKENVRLEGLIPEQLREDSEALTEMMNSYYEFMNLFGHYYKKSEVSHYATVINGEILFRADANTYFYDIDFTDSILYDSDSNPITFDTRKAYIMGTDNLPDALADDETTYGTLFQIEADEIENYTSQQLRLVTPIIVYVGDAPSFAMNNVLEQRDIDVIRSKYLEMVQREIAAVIPKNLQSDKKLLYKNITQFYRERGSEESVKVFFQILLNDQVEIKYPYEDVLIPSSGNWDPDSISTVPVYDNTDGSVTGYTTQLGAYLDHNGFLSDKKKLQDSFFYQKFAYLIRTGSNVATWENAFNKLIHPAGFKFFGEIVMFIDLVNQAVEQGDDIVKLDSDRINSSMNRYQPGLIGLEDISLVFEFFSSLTTPQLEARIHKSARIGTVRKNGDGTIAYVEIADAGYGYTSAPDINIDDPTGSGVTFNVELDESGSIKTVNKTNDGVSYLIPTDAGSGYTLPTGTIDTNANEGSLASVEVSARGMRYNGTVNGEVDESPLGTTAEISIQTDSNGYVTGATITNAGSGYTLDPKAYVIPTEGVKRDHVAEFLPILILSIENDNKYKQTIRDRWFSLLHFFDNTEMSTMADYTFEDIENKVINHYLNVGTEIYDQHGFMDPVDFTGVNGKLTQNYL